MKKKLSLAIIMLLLVGTLFALSSCGKKKEEGPILVPPSPSWACTFTQEKDVFDRNEVYLTFTCKDFTIQRYLYQDFDPKIYSVDYEEGTDQYKSWYDNALALYEEKRKRCPEYIELYYGMKGEEYFIKSITELTFAAETAFAPWTYTERLQVPAELLTELTFAAETAFAPWTYTERLQVPAELFVDEYGLIRFGWKFMPQDKDEKAGLYCAFYYKKTGNTVQISKEDLKPPYKYNIDYPTKAAKGFRAEAKQDNCAFLSSTRREIDDENDFEINFYFGRIYGEDEKNVPAVDIYIIIQSASGKEEKTFVRTVNDYMSDEYLCTRTYDYDGNVIEIIYNHSEKLSIPKDCFIGDSGEIEIAIFAHENQEKLGSTIIKYDADKKFNTTYYIH